MKLQHKALLLLLASFALYFATRSIWLDEWDSVQFALGIKDFNLWKHQPHPPGYPIYIFAARCLNALGMDPITALILIACASGSVFVTAWFLITRREFGESFGWLIALATMATPAVWMTATKALTDMPAAAALSVTIWLAFNKSDQNGKSHFLWSVLAGAVTTGLRPQWIGIILILLITALLRAKATPRRWAISLAVFVLGNLLWLIPTCISQSQAQPYRLGASAYPRQLVQQWRWRLDKPNVYVAAGGINARQIKERLVQHAEGYLHNGLGIEEERQRKIIALLLFASVILTLWRRPNAPFWINQTPWALALMLIAFCCLPEDRRYYMPVTPLLFIASLSGVHHLGRPARFGVWLVPAALLGTSLPLAMQGHRIPPPPVQMIHYLETQHPVAQRDKILLLLEESKRHAEWYAHAFNIQRARSDETGPRTLRRSEAIYTDRADFPLTDIFSGCVLEPVATFRRNSIIYPKHSTVRLFEIRKPQST